MNGVVDAVMMKERPFYRWKSFWLGVFVLVFFSSAWVRSVHHRDEVSLFFTSVQRELTLGSRAGSCTLSWEELPVTGAIWPAFVTRSRERDGGTWFQEAVEITDMGGGHYWAETAYWFLILLFLAAWLGFLFWRVRKQREIRR
ncbi:hypothetical protein [Luteolibacter soli]|uniref:Uncharacterized protein n=1 Tax=Luteolibacter soli TaxID=3135280 RepID=A0ABU9AV19_9BACT